MPPDVVLASTSRYRQELLARLRIPFTVESSLVDEDAVGRSAPPAERAILLAKAKAEAVASRHEAAIVIGSDQICTIDGRCLDKPGTTARAIAQLMELQGRGHELITAVHLVTPSGPLAFVERARLRMRALTHDEVVRYVDQEQPLDCAGSYRIEGYGVCLFEAVESADPTAIIGLPLMSLSKALVALGHTLP